MPNRRAPDASRCGISASYRGNGMTNAIVAQLSSDTFASALGFTVKSPSPVLALCRKLVESSTCGSSIPLECFRGAILCLKVRSIGEGAALEIDSRPRFQRRRPPRAPQRLTDEFD